MNDTRAVTPSGDTHDHHPVHVSGAAGGEIVAMTEPATDAPVRQPDIDPVIEPEADVDDQPEAGFNDEPEAELDVETEIGRDDEPLPADTRPRFSDLGLSEAIVRAVEEKGYLHPTPIQEQAIPFVLMGRDVLGVAQTGTGKTAGFTLPMIDILSGSRARARMPRSLILEPTRELALQVAENFVEYGRYLKLNHALLIGGESLTDQKEALNRGVDVLIATPGRLIDLFERGGLLLNDTRLLVIDEADRMLDMGFIPDVERIASLLSPTRQTLFFSATMAPEIKRLADAFLQNPKLITVSRAASVATTIEAGLVLVEERDKRRALRTLLRTHDVANALIFCNRKRDVDVLFKSLAKHGFSAGALHGDMPQSVRFATLEGFKAGEIRLLVCSDVAARGIDIGGLSHVFNFDVPIHAEDYVHRIGRTGRAGRTGHAYSIATPDDRLLVDAIEKLTGAPIARIEVAEIDRAAWSDTDTRKRRSRRGGAKPTARTAEPSPRPAAQSRSQPAKALPLKTQPAQIQPPQPQPSQPQPAPPQPSQAARPPRADNPPQRRDRDADRPRDRDRDRDGERDHGRARERDRDVRARDHRREDLGPPVRAFGDETPGFMFLPRRAGPVTSPHDTAEELDFAPEDTVLS